MRYSLLLACLMGLLGAVVITAPAAAQDVEPLAGLESIAARCSAKATPDADYQHCVARLTAQWQQAQLEAARPSLVVKPDAPDVSIDWRSEADAFRPSGDALAEGLRLSLDGD